VKWANWFASTREVLILFGGTSEGGGKEDFEEAISLVMERTG